jgi:murein DD-endopeptidase MepM/ murein hydrolase activator NlpD
MDRDDAPELSFDPRAWVRKTPTAAAESAGAHPAARAPSRRGLLAGAGAGAAAAAAGAGGWAMLHRSRAEGPAGAKPAPAGLQRRSFVVASAADLAGALAAAGLEPGAAARVARAAAGALGPAPGDLRVAVSLDAGPPARFVDVEIRRADGGGVVARPGAAGDVVVAPLGADLKRRIQVVRGEMDADSFYASAVSAGVTDSLIPEFAKAFAFDFDFQREIRPGDIFEAVFEQQVNDASEAVGAQRLLYAALQTQAKSRALYRFQPPGEAAAAWFDGAGGSVVRSLMRTPVEGARVSSTFGPRMHPVLGYTRMHKGIDFATPVGTPVYASGDGVVDFVGVHGGHGEYVRIRHSPTLETAYAHLSAYAPETKVGAAVRQGQEIARSGNTGLSSGPHLHYEVIVDNAQVDPMSFQTEQGRRLAGPALAAFLKARDRIDALRAAQHG